MRQQGVGQRRNFRTIYKKICQSCHLRYRPGLRRTEILQEAVDTTHQPSILTAELAGTCVPASFARARRFSPTKEDEASGSLYLTLTLYRRLRSVKYSIRY